MANDPLHPRLTVTTTRVPIPEDLLHVTPPDAPVAWLRRGDGLVGLGAPVLRLSATGDGRAAELARAWRDVAAHARVRDDVGLPGTGLIAFGALAFDDRSAAESALVVPSAVLGRRGAEAWLTVFAVEGAEPVVPDPVAYGPYWSASLGPGDLDPAGYQAAVAAGLSTIAAGEVGKVVLARDLVGTAPADADLRRLVRELNTAYPDCWTYAVDGMIGASPETLVTVSGGTVTARVLAGTIGRGPDADADNAAAAELATSAKDRDEHGYAVRSLVSSLTPFVSALAYSDEPFTLKLPNVWHLATDVEGVLSIASSALDLVGALHPTAAVAGTPTRTAMDVIARIEPFDRGRYAGPVGWIDSSGNGEWAIGLRCVQVAPAADGAHALTAHAGAGIVAGSDPEREMLETRVKFRPIVEALA
ncbi:isochorismate synthase [Microbacterium gorillae]|uniref:isochorismate synthase n=1 Tax=Microbacterium gorillae TaxID=1231063 RepID=UPI00058CB6FB|nr:isochorismate synthase [Microbacterium gorillae]